MTDDGFQVPSSDAQMAMKVATEVLAWFSCEANQESLNRFSTWLVNSLDICFRDSGSLKLRREKMWGDFHRLRTSDKFKREWGDFLEEIGQVALPAFYQFVSNVVFKELVHQHHQISTTETQSGISPLTFEEENALRYVAGHVCRKVQAQLNSSSIPNKDDMVLFIMDLSGDEMDESKRTEAWTNAIDRGGLWHVNDDTYTIFYLIEEETRKHFRATAASTIHAGSKETLLDKIMQNEDLLFQWCVLSSRVDESVGMHVLKMITELYITIRGFAFTTACLELYKQAHKKKLQKSKALRRKLQPLND